VTVDFEPGLVNAVQSSFADIRIIGCLFHLKQALWRTARSYHLGTKELIKRMSDLIDEMASLCWDNNEFPNFIEKAKNNEDQNKETHGLYFIL